MPKEIKKTVYSFKEMVELEASNSIKSRAVERAREWLQQAATDHDWWEFEYDRWEEALQQIGLMDPEISFRGFWSQGDGASFTCKSVDLARLIDFLSTSVQPSETIQPTERTGKDEDYWPYIVHATGGVQVNPKFRKLKRLADHISDVHIERIDSHYVHWNTCRFRADLDDRGDYDHTQPKDRDGWHPWKSRTPRVRTLFQEFREAAEELRKDISRAIYKDLEEEYRYRTSDESLIEDAEANDWTFDDNGRLEG